MNAIPKKKLCWNCEGNVSLSDETCSYCGVSVVPSSLDGSNENLIPPYRFTTSHKDYTIPLAPYASESSDASVQEKEDGAEPNATVENPSSSYFKGMLLPMILLLTGSVFFLFGLILMLFSQDGLLVLKWKTGFWFLYLLVSLPLLFFGWRAVQKLNDAFEEV
jgi:hypothetical protein